MISKTAEKLRDPEYRKAYIASQINIGLPFQIRSLLKARGWTQAQLAEKTDMLQPRISGLMTPGKVRPNIETLRRVAEAFDCGLIVRFAPFSEIVKWSDSFDPEGFTVPSFEHDGGFKETERQLKLREVGQMIGQAAEQSLSPQQLGGSEGAYLLNVVAVNIRPESIGPRGAIPISHYTPRTSDPGAKFANNPDQSTSKSIVQNPSVAGGAIQSNLRFPPEKATSIERGLTKFSRAREGKGTANLQGWNQYARG